MKAIKYKKIVLGMINEAELSVMLLYVHTPCVQFCSFNTRGIEEDGCWGEKKARAKPAFSVV